MIVPKNEAYVDNNGRKLGVICKGKNGNFVLLNPYGKSRKIVAELKGNVSLTNYGEVKKDENGKLLRLNKRQRAWRSGYLSAQNDSAKCYKATKGKGRQK